MYPHSLFLGLTLYDIFILVGVVAAFLLADRMTVKRGFSVSLQRIVIICALSAVIVGYGSAVLFQAFYNIAERGKFVIDANTGATFYGGLIGGAGAFLLVYFIAGKHFCKDNEAVKRFPDMLDIGACCIPLAHAFGRLGCLTAAAATAGKRTPGTGSTCIITPTARAKRFGTASCPFSCLKAFFSLPSPPCSSFCFSKTGENTNFR